MSTIKAITLLEFSKKTALHWESCTDNWTRVTDTETGVPLWEFERGSAFIFENESLPRFGWSEFRRMRLGDRKTLLAENKVIVLTWRRSDVFLVRLADDTLPE